MTTRTDGEIEAVYKAGHAHSHAAGLREVYQAGRADEAHALLSHSKSAQAAAGDAPKRPIKNPGDPTTEAGSPTAPAQDAPVASAETPPAEA